MALLYTVTVDYIDGARSVSKDLDPEDVATLTRSLMLRMQGQRKPVSISITRKRILDRLSQIEE